MSESMKLCVDPESSSARKSLAVDGNLYLHSLAGGDPCDGVE